MWTNGIPSNISIRANGKPVWDVRTGTIASSDNPALCLYDYLTNTIYGKGVLAADIDLTSFQAAANICDQLVSGVKRYRIHGSVSLDETYNSIIGKILDSMCGQLTCTGGYWTVYAGAYRSPTVTLTDDDLRGDLTVNTRLSMRDIFNRVSGIYCDMASDQPATYPVVTNPIYVTEDGAIIPLTLDLDLVADSAQAQRTANIVLEKARQEITIKYPASLRALKLSAGDTVMITNVRMGWSSKVFEVQNWGFQINQNEDGNAGELIIPLDLRETAAEVYDDYAATAIDPAPNTNLPKSTDIADVTGLTVTESLIHVGDIVGSKVILTWTGADTYCTDSLEYLVSYKLHSDSNYIYIGNFTRDLVEIVINTVGSHDFKVVTMNLLGTKSTGTILTQTILGKTAPPADVTGFTVTTDGQNILLSWDQSTELDFGDFELQGGGTVWDVATDALGRFKVNKTTKPPRPAGAYIYRIKARDTGGPGNLPPRYSLHETTFTFTVLSPLQPVNNGTRLEFNKIQFLFSDCKTTFNIRHYDIYRGYQYAGALLIGNSNSTAFTHIETLTGLQTYWIVAVDIYGNPSNPMQIILTIINPPDYKFVADYIDDFITDAILTDCIKEVYTDHFGLTGPINTTKTWADYTADFGDVVPTKSLEEIYPVSIGKYIKQWDSGSLATNGGTLQLLYNLTDFSGDIIMITPTISLSTDNVIWIDHAGVNSLLITDPFRYIKITLDFSGGGVGKLIQISNLMVKIFLQRKYEYGSINFDGSGIAVINFVNSFIDIDQINFTAVSPGEPVTFDIKDCWSGNPAFMTVSRYNSGVLGAGPAKYEIIGV